MPTPSYTVTCTRKVEIAPDVFEFALTKPEGFSFKAGQFVLFDVPLVGNPADVQARAYSIASVPSDPELLFAIKLVPGGRMSTFVQQVLQPGVTLTMKGPFGVFVLSPGQSEHILLACTGAGVVPFRSMIADALTKGDTRPMHLLFNVRHEQDFFWLETFRAWEKQHAAFHVHLSLTQPHETWKGLQGRVQQCIPELLPDLSQTLLYACGNPDMTKEVKALAIGPWGMAKERVHIEGYI